MSNSPNLGLNLQVTGTNNGTWGITLNANQSIIDSRLGARLSKDIAGNSNITVSSTEAQNFFMTLTGALTGNIKYILPAQGAFYFIKNSTSGAFTLTVVNDVGGTGIVIDQGNASFLVSNPDTTTVSTIIPSTLASLSVAALTVTSSIALPAGAIGTAVLATDAVTTVKITDANVTTAKIATGAITAIKIGSGAATSGQVLTADGAGAATYTTISNTDSFGTQLLQIQDQESSGVNGGTFLSGAWRTRVLNTVLVNQISGASLSSNQISLVAGTYIILAKATAYAVGSHQLRLQNITDTSTILTGISEGAIYVSDNAEAASLEGRFVISGTKIIELQHRSSGSQSVYGLGAAGSFGTEVYADVMIWKVA